MLMHTNAGADYSKSSKYVVISTQIPCLFTLRPGLPLCTLEQAGVLLPYTQILVHTKPLTTGDWRL